MSQKKTNISSSTQPKETQTPTRLIFAKNCTNNHGRFKKGDRARGAFAPELVATYLELGILVHGTTD
jgi:hypothetical protein